MKRDEIRLLVIEAITDSDRLTEVIDKLDNAINPTNKTAPITSQSVELTVEEQNFLPILIDRVESNDSLFGIVMDGSKEAEIIDGLMSKLVDAYKGLQHHKDTTCGLWATDRKDLVQDPENIMFQIDY